MTKFMNKKKEKKKMTAFCCIGNGLLALFVVFHIALPAVLFVHDLVNVEEKRRKEKNLDISSNCDKASVCECY